MLKDSPHPQVPDMLGLLKTNSLASLESAEESLIIILSKIVEPT